MTDFYTNSLTKSGANVEGTYGTKPASFQWFGGTQTFNINKSNETVKNRTQNLSREVFSIDVTKQIHAGDYSFRVQDFSFILAAFGTLATVGVSAPYTHTFTTGDSLVSYAMYNEIKARGTATDIVDIYTGLKTNEYKLSVTENDYLICTNTVIGNGKLVNQTPEVFSASTVKAFKYADIVDGSISINSVNVKFNSYEYTRSNTLSEEQSGLTISEPCAQELVEDLSLNLKLSTQQIADLVNTGAEVEVEIAFIRGADSLTITHQVVFKEAPENKGTEGTIDIAVTADIRTTTIVGIDTNATYTF